MNVNEEREFSEQMAILIGAPKELLVNLVLAYNVALSGLSRNECPSLH